MTNFFNFNIGFSYGMNNWFMPTFEYTNNSSQYQIFDFFNNWFNNFNFSNNYFSPMFQPNFLSVFGNNTSIKQGNTDTFISTTKPETKSEKSNTNTNNLKLDGYNAFKGERLAKIALNNSVGWTGYCATYVKNSIQQAGLGLYQYGHAYQMTNILKNNSNFKQISPDGVDVKSLPAGCVLVYNRGTQGYSKEYGHTEITTGDGRAVSDGITKNLYKKPSAIFIPV